MTSMPLPSRAGRVKRPGATRDQIETAQALLVTEFPLDYTEFLLNSDGAVGILGEDYLALWSLAEVISVQKDAAVEEFAPGLILFGSDGGDTVYAFMNRGEVMYVVEVSLEGLSLDSAKVRASSFTEFLTLWMAGQYGGRGD